VSEETLNTEKPLITHEGFLAYVNAVHELIDCEAFPIRSVWFSKPQDPDNFNMIFGARNELHKRLEPLERSLEVWFERDSEGLWRTTKLEPALGGTFYNTNLTTTSEDARKHAQALISYAAWHDTLQRTLKDWVVEAPTNRLNQLDFRSQVKTWKYRGFTLEVKIF
jgi:hypothetical protein